MGSDGQSFSRLAFPVIPLRVGYMEFVGMRNG